MVLTFDVLVQLPYWELDKSEVESMGPPNPNGEAYERHKCTDTSTSDSTVPTATGISLCKQLTMSTAYIELDKWYSLHNCITINYKRT